MQPRNIMSIYSLCKWFCPCTLLTLSITSQITGKSTYILELVFTIAFDIHILVLLFMFHRGKKKTHIRYMGGICTCLHNVSLPKQFPNQWNEVIQKKIFMQRENYARRKVIENVQLIDKYKSSFTFDIRLKFVIKVTCTTIFFQNYIP